MVAGQVIDVLVEYTNTAAPDGVDENGAQRLAQPALMKGVVCVPLTRPTLILN